MSSTTRWWSDAFRALRAKPTLTLAATTCLALGIGPSTAVYSVLHAVLVSPLPFAEPQELAIVWSRYPGADGQPTDYYTTTENFVRIEESPAFEVLTGVLDLDFDIQNAGTRPQRVLGAQTSVSVFRVAGTLPIAGRLFTPEDAAPGRDHVVVIREDLWEQRFARSPSALGSDLLVDGVSRTIIGVVGMRTAFPLRSTIWIPLVPDAMTQERKERGMLTLVGRLRPETTVAATEVELAAVARTLREEHPVRNRDLGLTATPLQSALVGDTGPTIVGLMVGVVLLLAIACANVANLTLVRLEQDRPNIALRLALGATRGRVVLDSLRTGVVLALLGGTAGIALAFASVDPLVALAPADVYGLDTVRMSGPVLGFSLAVSLATVLLFGAAPALLASRTAPGDALRAARAGSRTASSFQSRFVAAQAAVGVVLLVAAGLAVKAVRELRRVDPGFDTAHSLTFRFMAPQGRYPNHDARMAFFEEVLAEVRALPGVEGAAGAHVLPIGDVSWGFSHSVEDLPPTEPSSQYMSFLRVITPDYFRTMRTPLVAGREFDRGDNMESAPVAIVSERLARQYWPGEDPIGKRIKSRVYDSENPWLTVVGVASNVRDGGLADEPSKTVYLPYAQRVDSYTEFMSVVVRTRAPVTIDDIVARTAQVDPGAAVFRVRSLQDLVGGSLTTDLFSAWLLSLFAALGSLLTAVGVYGVTEHTAGRRRRELAIRRALGARQSSLGVLLLRRALGLALAGGAVGLIAVALLRVTALTERIGVDALDPTVLVLAPSIVCAVAVLSCLRPSWKAATVAPSTVLRED